MIWLLAAALRLYQLDVTPPGLHYDEAFKATQALSVLAGKQFPIFFVGNFGEEPLQIYATALVFKLLGASPYAVRLTSALLGLLTIPAIFLAARFLSPERRGVRWLATFIAATLYWHINFSRLGLETIGLPLFAAWSAALFWWAQRSQSRAGFALAGFLIGGALYTYLASRLFPLVFVLFALFALAFQREWFRRQRAGFVVAALVAILTFAPLGAFFAENPTALAGRAGQVTLTESEQRAALVNNTLATAAMFWATGDQDPRDNLPGRPALDPFLGIGFAVGIVASAYRAIRQRSLEHAFLLIWLVVMISPSAFTEFAPNFRRAIGALPAVVLLTAFGFAEVWRVVADRNPFSWRKRVSLAVILALGLAYSAGASVNDYFNVWARGTGLYYSFDEGLLNVGRALAEEKAEQVFLSPDHHDHPTVQFALGERAWSSFDGRKTTVLADATRSAAYAVVLWEDQDGLARLRAIYPDGRVTREFFDRAGALYAVVFEIPRGARAVLEPARVLNIRLGDTIRLRGYTLIRADGRIRLMLFWQGSAREDYTVFVHVVGASSAPPLVQADSQPGAGTFPTSRWMAGQTIVDEYALEAPPGDYQVQVGMYLLATGKRLPAFDAAGERLANDRILLP